MRKRFAYGAQGHGQLQIPWLAIDDTHEPNIEPTIPPLAGAIAATG